MRTFIGRREELSALAEVFDSPRSEFRVIRGRRRIGKTRLLTEAAKDRTDTIFFTGAEDVTADKKNRERICEKLADFAKDDVLKAAKGLSWNSIFEKITKIAASRQNMMIIFDEIQWIARQGSGFLSDLKEAWTRLFQPSGKTKIIICGSSSKFFEHKSSGSESVLYKLRTMSDIRLKPMTLSETSQFCEGWNRQEVVMAQMMFGGVPYYLDLIIAPERGFVQCINDIAFTSKTIFFDEVVETLKLDLSSTTRAIQILSVLGQSGKTLKQISENAHLSASTVDELAEKLVDYGVLYKRYPLGLQPKANDFGMKYFIADEFLNFYFNVLDREQRAIKNNVSGRLLFKSVFKEGYYIKNFTGKAFELVISKIIKGGMNAPINKKLSINNLEKYEVGSFWRTGDSDGNQIDIVVSSDEDRCTRLIEAKWTNKKVGAEPGNAIEQVLNRDYPNPKGHKINRFVVSSSGFTSEAVSFASKNQVGTIELDDLFDQPRSSA